MSVNVYIPTPFRHLVGNRANVRADGDTISDLLIDLDHQFHKVVLRQRFVV